MGFVLDEDDAIRVRPHLRKVRGERARSGRGRSGGSGFTNSQTNKWNFAQGSRAAVFHKIGTGGTNTRNELRRQMDYINNKAKYTFGQSEYVTDDTKQPKTALEAIADQWEPAWSGNPKNGHTSHLLISFPPDTKPRDAANIAEEMCERAFGAEKTFANDKWEYVAALHTDRSHPHVHVILNNRGVENGTWFFLSNNPEAQFTYQAMRNLMVSVAKDYGVELEATTRYERGDLQYSPSTAQWRNRDNPEYSQPGFRARTERVEAMLIDEADDWGVVASAAAAIGNDRVLDVATRMIEGITSQTTISREELEMELQDVKTPEEFDKVVSAWAERARDNVMELPPEMQGEHLDAIGNEMNRLNTEFGFVYEAQGVEFPGRIADTLHVDSELLKGRAVDYMPEGQGVADQTLDRAIEMFSAGVQDKEGVRDHLSAGAMLSTSEGLGSDVIAADERHVAIMGAIDGDPEDVQVLMILGADTSSNRDRAQSLVDDPAFKSAVQERFPQISTDSIGVGKLDDNYINDRMVSINAGTNAVALVFSQDEDRGLADDVVSNPDLVGHLVKGVEGYATPDASTVNEHYAALEAVQRANEDYSFEPKSGAIGAFWDRFAGLANDAAIDRNFARSVFENDVLSDETKVIALANAVDQNRQPSISAEDMFAAVQQERSEMRANIVTPDSDYLTKFMQRLTEREYPTAAPEFSSRVDEKEYAAAIRAHFGSQGLERIAEGDYKDLEAITANKLHQRELAASVLAVAEMPAHAEKLGLEREQIATGYDAADEHQKAQRALGRSLGDEFSL